MGTARFVVWIVVGVFWLVMAPGLAYTLVTGRWPRFPLGPRRVPPMTPLRRRMLAGGQLLLALSAVAWILQSALLPVGYWAWWQGLIAVVGLAGAILALRAEVTQRPGFHEGDAGIERRA